MIDRAQTDSQSDRVVGRVESFFEQVESRSIDLSIGEEEQTRKSASFCRKSAHLQSGWPLGSSTTFLPVYLRSMFRLRFLEGNDLSGKRVFAVRLYGHLTRSSVRLLYPVALQTRPASARRKWASSVRLLSGPLIGSLSLSLAFESIVFLPTVCAILVL